MRVLLVEDNPEFRSLLGQALRPLGARIVFECGTQREAIAWLEAHREGWDIALVDLFLAEGHGFALLRHCATRQAWQKTVLMTNYVREPVLARALAAGANAFFDKSTQLEELIAYCIQASLDLAERRSS